MLTSASAATVSNGALLQVSDSSSRADAVGLAGAHLSGQEYVFVTAPTSAHVSSVVFYLDGKIVRTEKQAPFDFAGGTASAAEPFNVSNLPAGAHRISATVKMTSGTAHLNASFATSSTTSSAGATAAPSTTSATAALQVSASADRSGGKSLSGQTLSGSQYVFVKPSSTTPSSVVFSLDGKLVRTEKLAPFDLEGGTLAKAVALNVSALAAGKHTVAAAVTAAGKTTTLTGSFAAQAASTAPPVQPAPTSAPTTAPAPSPTPTSAPTQPSPTSAPTSAPAAPSGSFDPVHFDWNSVGGPSSGMTQMGGTTDLALRTANQIFDRVQFTVKVLAQATGIGVSNCSLGVFHADADGLSVKNCTISGGVFGLGSYTLDHNFITSNSDGIDPAGPGYKVIQYNKIWRDGTRVGTLHEDGIQFTQGGNALISRNYISGWQTSAIMVKADLGPISNITIDSNYLNNPTGYYQLYLCPVSHSLSNITVTNNAFGKATSTLSTCGTNYTYVHTQAQRQAAINAGVKGADQWVVWNNNYIAATGAIVAPPGGWAQ